MKKKNLADKMAEKFLGSQKFKEHWDVHTQVFGPIIEPAFKDDSQSRLHLANALSNISRGELKDGIKILEKLKDKVKTDADDACWLFCMGLVFDIAGMTDNMLEYYMASCEYNHSFYMPYMKIAKNAYADRAFDAAESYFKRALYCFVENNLMDDGASQVLIASIYTHLCSVLTSMHRYSEAEEYMALSEQTIPSQPGRSSTKAILCAVTGKHEEALQCIQELKNEAPQFIEDTQKMVDDIINKTSASFFETEIDKEEIISFWAWFTENEDHLTEMITSESYEEFFGILGDRLLSVFPFMQASLEFGIEPQDGGFKLIFVDFYAVSLSKGYEKLIANCPEELNGRWTFDICR